MLGMADIGEGVFAGSAISVGAERSQEDRMLLENCLFRDRLRRQEEHDQTRSWCFGCMTSIKYCECQELIGAGGGVDHFKNVLYEASHSDRIEHRWGCLFARRPTVQDHNNARDRRENIERALASGTRKRTFEKAAKTLGSTLGYNVAMFAEQTGLSDEEISELAEPLLKEMMDAAGRVKDLHSKYEKILYDEFDNPDTRTIEGAHTKVFLGRDGVYPLISHWAARASSRVGVSPESRRPENGTQGQVRYIEISRNCHWQKGEHTPLLGDRRPVFIDTGYQGSIPQHIMREEGQTLDVRDAQRPDYLPYSPVRLLCTDLPGYAFRTQIKRTDSTRIEHDAKATRSAYKVNMSNPTPALEQLVYRQLRHSIIDTSSRETLARRRASGENVPDGIVGEPRGRPQNVKRTTRRKIGQLELLKKLARWVDG